MDTKALCLGVLSIGDSTGYEIKKALAEGPFAHFQYAGFGSIYPTLTRLEAEGLVAGASFAQKGRPDKRVYSITEAGRQAFRNMLLEDPGSERYRSDHLFMLFFGDDVDVERRRAVRESFVGYYRDVLAVLESKDSANAPPGMRFAHQMGIAIYRAAVEFLENQQPEWFENENESEDVPMHLRRAGE